MHCLIVDDETPARVEMRQLLSVHPEIQIVGEAANVADALEICRNTKLDVIFLDIQLRAETGFDLIGQLEIPSPRIVFVTAFDRYAIRAFECNALDYLLKPVHPERLRETVERLRTALTQPPRAGAEDSVFLKINTTARFVPWREILCIESEGNYTRVSLVRSAPILILRSLREWDEMAPSGAYLQVHRGALVRMDAITEVRTNSDGRRELILSNAATIRVGRAYWPNLKAVLA